MGYVVGDEASSRKIPLFKVLAPLSLLLWSIPGGHSAEGSKWLMLRLPLLLTQTFGASYRRGAFDSSHGNSADCTSR